MSPRFEGKFGIPPSHTPESLLTSALYRLPESINPEFIENLTQQIVERVNRTLKSTENPHILSSVEVNILQLKLARHYEDNGESAHIDIRTLIDALIESPKFLQNDRGSILKLFEIHEVKTLQRIAEIRRQKAEQTHNDGLNPYENLFGTESGRYYLARLLNMPHLEDESDYMNHCVGTSTSYINKIKRGEVEIFSLRDATTHDPIVTIEYDRKERRLLQVKAHSDRIPTLADEFSSDLIQALDKLQHTEDDKGELRAIRSSEVADLRTLLTLQEKQSRGEALSREGLVFLYEMDRPITGFDQSEREPLIAELRKSRDIDRDMLTLFDCTPDQIARTPKTVNASTKAYIGPWNPTVFQTIKQYPSIEHLYTSFPDKKIFRKTLETDPSINSPEKAKGAFQAKNMIVTDRAQDILKQTTFSQEAKTYELVQFTVAELGFLQGATNQEIYAKAKELGLELCPAEVGPHLRLQYQGTDWKTIAMDPMPGRDGSLSVFSLDSDDERLKLITNYARPLGRWHGNDPLVFLSRPSSRA